MPLHSSPYFSVLMASYNNGRFMPEAIDSVIAQTFKDWEIVIVDDASTDHSLQVAEQYIARGVNIKLQIHPQNLGCGATKRHCVELANGEICGFLDPDDVLTPDALQVMVEAHQQHPNASLVSSRYYICNEFLQNDRATRHQRPLRPDETYLEVRNENPIISHFATFKRSKYQQTSGIDAKFKRAVDQDLYFKMEEVGDLVFTDKHLYRYRIHKGGISLYENVDKSFYWHLLAIMDAGIRRGINFEDVVQNNVERALFARFVNRENVLKRQLTEAQRQVEDLRRASKKIRFSDLFRIKLNFKEKVYRMRILGKNVIDIAPAPPPPKPEFEKYLQIKNPAYPNICVCCLNADPLVPSETFIRAHIQTLPANIVALYGGTPPMLFADGNRLTGDAPDAYRNLFAETKIKAVLAEYGPVGASLMDICAAASVPLIVHFHDFDAAERAVLESYREEYRVMFAKAAAIVAVSQPMRDQLIALGCPAEKMYINPCGINLALFLPAPTDKTFDFLSVGRLVDKKAPYLLLLAFDEVLRQRPEARLKMVGDGPLVGVCKRLARSLGRQSQVEFLGARSHTEVCALMKQARVFVQHSVTAENGDAEGMPVAVLEAAASGLPVVSTRHAGIPASVIHGQTGYLVEEGDYQGMAGHMLELVQNQELARRMGEAGRAHITGRFSMEKSIAGLWHIIETAASKKNA